MLEEFGPTNPEIVNRLDLLNEYKRQRRMLFGEVANQLDMLFKDIDAGLFGDLAKEGSFYQHIISVKNAIEKPDVAAIQAELDALIINETNHNNI